MAGTTHYNINSVIRKSIKEFVFPKGLNTKMVSNREATQ